MDLDYERIERFKKVLWQVFCLVLIGLLAWYISSHPNILFCLPLVLIIMWIVFLLLAVKSQSFLLNAAGVLLFWNLPLLFDAKSLLAPALKGAFNQILSLPMLIFSALMCGHLVFQLVLVCFIRKWKKEGYVLAKRCRASDNNTDE